MNSRASTSTTTGERPAGGRRSRRKPSEQPASIISRFKAILQSDPLINSVVAVAICAGFLHGWLKLNFRSPVTTFIYDALLCVALGLLFLQKPTRESFLPEGRVGQALKGFYAVCIVLMLVPWGPPVIISLAALRGWCFATLMFALGYRLTKHLTQVKGYFYVLILLGLLTSIYGLRQDPNEISRLMDEDEEFARRYMGTYYVTSKGTQLRIFSTFVSSGAFGGTLAYVAVFAIVLISDSKSSRLERVLLVSALIPISYALVRTGARSALLTLIFGFIVIAWHRRDYFNWVFVPLALAGAFQLAVIATGGSADERYRSLLELDELYYRLSIPTSIGWHYMVDGHLLGGGLGRSGYSVPMFLPAMVGFRDFVGADGDLGRLLIDMGLLGIIFFGRLLWVVVGETLDSLAKLKATPLSTVALASAACIVMAVTAFPSGSPFLGIPMGTLVWFFLGTLMKLRDMRHEGSIQEESGNVPADEPPILPSKPFLHRQPTPRRRRVP